VTCQNRRLVVLRIIKLVVNWTVSGSVTKQAPHLTYILDKMAKFVLWAFCQKDVLSFH